MGPVSNPYRPDAGGYAAPHPRGTQVLVLGLLGLVLCPVAVVGFVRGNHVLHEIDANPGLYGNRTAVVVGRALSIAVLVLAAAAIVFYLVAVVALGRYDGAP